MTADFVGAVSVTGSVTLADILGEFISVGKHVTERDSDGTSTYVYITTPKRDWAWYGTYMSIVWHRDGEFFDAPPSLPCHGLLGRGAESYHVLIME